MNDKICGYILDKEQQSIVLDESKNLLVVAGAGSGKTLTIIGKIYYLIRYKNINPKDILCISFTKASSDNLREKLKKELVCDIPVYTFHKLSLEILKENHMQYQIVENDMLKNIITNFFAVEILDSSKHMTLVLNYFGEFLSFNIKKKYLELLKSKRNELGLLYQLIETFIRLFKCNNHDVSDFIKFNQNSKKTIKFFQYYKEKSLLIIIINIFLKYQEYLEQNQEIDFDDMITKATSIVEQKGIKHRYQYVIIDEYQDTSKVRFLLIKSILEKTGAKLMVVGDDFQSIYRFTGCDLSLFVDFVSYFDNAKIMKIQTTYRNSQELISVAGKFVMQNKKQIKKILISDKHLNKPIKIVYYQNIKDSFVRLVNKIYNETKKSILVLGRNNKDIDVVLGEEFKLEDESLIYLKNPEINIKYLTVHRSKGLEADVVIIINMENNLLGFPNKIKDDRILRFVSINSEKQMYSEERRLFYVALTRTKSYVYLMTQKGNQSIFIDELLQNYKNEIELISI